MDRLETDFEAVTASANASLAVAEQLRGEAETLERNITSISFEDISSEKRQNTSSWKLVIT